MSRQTGIADSNISRWLDESNPRKPTTDKLALLAPVLGVDYGELVQMLYPPTRDKPIVTPLPDETREKELLQRTEQFREALRGTPRAFWAAVVEAGISLANATSAIPTPAPPPVSGPPTRRVRKPGQTPNRAQGRRTGGLQDVYHLPEYTAMIRARQIVMPDSLTGALPMAA